LGKSEFLREPGNAVKNPEYVQKAIHKPIIYKFAVKEDPAPQARKKCIFRVNE